VNFGRLLQATVLVRAKPWLEATPVQTIGATMPFAIILGINIFAGRSPKPSATRAKSLSETFASRKPFESVNRKGLFAPFTDEDE
jgi:hypothetical protein